MSSDTNTKVDDEEALIHCDTTKGPFVMKMYRHWTPHGYDRAVALFEQGFYDHSHFFRVVPEFLVQFGISYTDDPALKDLADTPIPDDPQLDPRVEFAAGTVSFAGGGPDSRTSHLFVSYVPHKNFGTEKWEVPVGKVIEGLDNLKKMYSYGDMPPWGNGPVQGKIHQGRQYIDKEFPLTDSFETCRVERMRPGREVLKPAVMAGNVMKHLKSSSSEKIQASQKALHNLRERVLSHPSMSSSSSNDVLTDWRVLTAIGCLLLVCLLLARSLLGPKKIPSKSS